jgi:hypothetical protein
MRPSGTRENKQTNKLFFDYRKLPVIFVKKNR